MEKQNEMMKFVWLLNAANGSAFETKGLYLDFLRQQDDLQKVRQRFPADTPQSDYLERELRQNLEQLQELQKTIQAVIDVLRLPETGARQ